jgi:hypothetical protein
MHLASNTCLGGMEKIYDDIINDREIEGIRKCCAMIVAHFVIIRDIDNKTQSDKRSYSITLSEREIADKAQVLLKEMPEDEAQELLKMGTLLWMKIQDNVQLVDANEKK